MIVLTSAIMRLRHAIANCPRELGIKLEELAKCPRLREAGSADHSATRAHDARQNLLTTLRAGLHTQNYTSVTRLFSSANSATTFVSVQTDAEFVALYCGDQLVKRRIIQTSGGSISRISGLKDLGSRAKTASWQPWISPIYCTSSWSNWRR
jgi:hypothetical protein